MGKMQQFQREFLYNKTFLQISLQNIYVFIKTKLGSKQKKIHNFLRQE